MIRDLLWALISFGMFLLGLAGAIRYVLRLRLAVIVRTIVATAKPAPPAKPSIPPGRCEEPTLTDIRVDRAIGELARKCRREETTPNGRP
jgi:hypothetical protein